MKETSIAFALTSSASREWYSGVELVEPARRVFGGFDVDPASCADVNNEVIRATRIFTADDDGLTKPWDIDGSPSRVWLNPPSDDDNSAAGWWVYLAKEFIAGRVRCAAFVIFNLSTVQVALRASRIEGVPPPQWGSRVEPANRIKYMRRAQSLALPGIAATFERSKSPPHPSAVVLLSDEPALHDAWSEAYAELGEVLPPAQMPNRRSS